MIKGLYSSEFLKEENSLSSNIRHFPWFCQVCVKPPYFFPQLIAKSFSGVKFFILEGSNSSRCEIFPTFLSPKVEYFLRGFKIFHFWQAIRTLFILFQKNLITLNSISWLFIFHTNLAIFKKSQYLSANH